MAKATIEIPDSVLDKQTKQYIKELENKLTNAQNREKRLKNKVKEQEHKVKLAQIILNKFGNFIEEFRYDPEYEDIFWRN